MSTVQFGPNTSATWPFAPDGDPNGSVAPRLELPDQVVSWLSNPQPPPPIPPQVGAEKMPLMSLCSPDAVLATIRADEASEGVRRAFKNSSLRFAKNCEVGVDMYQIKEALRADPGSDAEVSRPGLELGFWYALRDGNQVLAELIKKTIDAKGYDTHLLMHDAMLSAARTGNLRGMQLLVSMGVPCWKVDPLLVQAGIKTHEAEFLEAAAGAGKLGAVQALLNMPERCGGEPINQLQVGRRTRTASTEVPVQRCVNPADDLANAERGAALLAGVKSGSAPVLDALLRAGLRADLNDSAALAEALALRDEVSAAKLLAAGASYVGENNRCLLTLMNWATTGQVLGALRNGADPNALGGAVLVRAATLGNMEVVGALLEAGAHAWAGGSAALAAAVTYDPQAATIKNRVVNMKRLTIVQMLLAAGANPNAGHSAAVVEAARRGNVDVLRLFNGANLAAENGDALVRAAQGGHMGTVKHLIVAGVPASSQDSLALFHSAARGDLLLSLLLVTGGAQPSASDSAALVSAAAAGECEVMSLLLAYGARCDAQDGEPLVAAATKSRTDAVRLLIARGADVNAGGARALVAAVRAACNTRRSVYTNVKVAGGTAAEANRRADDATAAARQCVEALVNAGAHVNAGQLKSLLYMAAWSRDTEMARFLMSKGAQMQDRERAQLAADILTSMGLPP